MTSQSPEPPLFCPTNHYLHSIHLHLSKGPLAAQRTLASIGMRADGAVY